MSAMTDEEQLDGLKSFYKKYGSAILSGILIALIAFFGWEYWQKKTLAENQNQTARVQKLSEDAAVAQGNPAAYTAMTAAADKIVKDNPDSIHAVESQFIMARTAYEKGDYATAERELLKVQNSKLEDAGILQIVKLRLANTQLAQKKYDAALKTLATVTEPSFKATADEAKGDVYVAKGDMENARKSYQAAWNALVERKQDAQLLQIKLESVGVLVDDPEIERPIIATQVDES